MRFANLFLNLPEVKSPLQKRLPFNSKLKWTLIILLSFFILSNIPLHGLGQNQLANFELLSTLLGASFGSLISLGIGPIVTASIVLQLLKGSGILNLDTNTHDGRVLYQGIQKILTLFFIIIESVIYVFMGGLSPSAGLPPDTYRMIELWLVAQLILGGLLIMYMDEVTSKWGFGSGVSMFIAAGVSAQLMLRAFSPLSQAGLWALGTGQAPVGQVWVLITSLAGQTTASAGLALSRIIATMVIFVLVVYVQAMKVEIPLSFGRIRGHGIRWPLNFIYTSNIPVILVAALFANIQLWASLLERKGYTFLGTFIGNRPASGLVAYLSPPNIIENIITGSFIPVDIARALVFGSLMMGGAIIFSIFWVQTSGMDAKSQANQILGSGLQIPGFRRDQRVLEIILDRYIFPLTVMGGATVGLLAAAADLLGALVQGTSLLLSVMIIYRMYEDIARQHMMDMHPALRKFMTA
jgi:preprotein translocase subunit SecY